MAEALFQISEPGEVRDKAACGPRVVGIDLGTTNSLVAHVEGGRPICLRDTDPTGTGSPIVPSAVYYGKDGSVVVGRRARDELAEAYPRDTITSVKRFMGRGPGDAEALRTLTPFELEPPSPADPVVRFRVAGGTRKVTPMEVSAEILKVLRARAEAALGGALDGAVITVPAYFDDGQRQATRDAGRLAGLEVLRLVNEPTAAALAYGLDQNAQGTFAVFDLGGGTFDVSILKLEDGVFEVKATGGDSALGGDDMDRAVAGHILGKLGLPADAGGDRKLTRRVLDAARAAKERLTLHETTNYTVTRTDDTVYLDALTRAELDALVGPVVERCRGPVVQALRDAGVTARDLDGVVLVGGATRMPIVRTFVRELFGREPLADIDPDEVVALGAAVQADQIGGNASTGDVLLLDVVPLSLGLELMGGVVEKIIHRNTTVPCGATQTFTTYADKQTGFDLHVVQGERELGGECRSLARFKLGGIPPMPAGMARLQVTFTVDANGMLSVHAREETTGQEATIQVQPSYGLGEDDVERMLLDSFAHAENDVKLRLLTEQRIEAERIKQATLSALTDSPELLEAGDRLAIEAALATLHEANAGTDAQAIKSAVEGLDRASQAFAARRMNRAIERGLSGRRADEIEARADADIGRRGVVHGHDGHDHG